MLTEALNYHFDCGPAQCMGRLLKCPGVECTLACRGGYACQHTSLAGPGGPWYFESDMPPGWRKYRVLGNSVALLCRETGIELKPKSIEIHVNSRSCQRKNEHNYIISRVIYSREHRYAGLFMASKIKQEPRCNN